MSGSVAVSTRATFRSFVAAAPPSITTVPVGGVASIIVSRVVSTVPAPKSHAACWHAPARHPQGPAVAHEDRAERRLRPGRERLRAAQRQRGHPHLVVVVPGRRGELDGRPPDRRADGVPGARLRLVNGDSVKSGVPVMAAPAVPRPASIATAAADARTRRDVRGSGLLRARRGGASDSAATPVKDPPRSVSGPQISPARSALARRERSTAPGERSCSMTMIAPPTGPRRGRRAGWSRCAGPASRAAGTAG